MSAAIIERIINAETDKIMVLNREEMVRPLAVGHDWNDGLVLVRCSANGSTLAAGGFEIGFVSGTVNTRGRYLAGAVASVNNATFITNEAAATFNAGTPNYFNGGTNMRTRKFVTTTQTNLTFRNLTTDRWLVASPDTNRCILGYRFNKTNPGAVVTGPFYQSSTTTTDISAAVFASALDLIAPTGYDFSTTSAGTIDEATNGGLNCVYVLINDPSTSLEISDIAFVRFS